MDMRNKKVGDKVRTTEMVTVGELSGFFHCIPAGTEVEITFVYDAGTPDAAYRVNGPTNHDRTGSGVAFHDEIEAL